MNSLLLDYNYNIPSTLFHDKVSVAYLSNNRIELIEWRQQDSIFTAVIGELSRIAYSSESDNASSGRWNSIDLYSEFGKVRIIMEYHCIYLK